MTHSADKGIEQLDRARLLQLYEDDTETLISSIEMFLDEVVPAFQVLENLIEKQEWTGVTAMTHQLRPWLGMVGLTGLEQQLEAIERLTKENPHYEMIQNAYRNFIENLEHMQPVLKTELQQLTK
ncbi:Hpt domain-containing protein [Larkinella humicola]|uniref:Hpt domain-containing protein n=1 Tax=Larkinella humicola TaxID=2607654 RepID=A0A5N1JMD7_9BACT|nr:Hpt domain-containing protein [Larkinella humicola]KAA9357660.1 Hpt domain-containing protein [Larkinella humicola]